MTSAARRAKLRLLVAAAALAAVSAPIAAQAHGHTPPAKVGTVRFTTSCRPAAQLTFVHSVALLHSFAFPQATTGFNAALKGDPGCAMAWWGLALTAWGNPFAAGIKPEAQLQRGLDAVEHGRAITPITEREAAYIAAVAQLYDNYHAIDQRARVLAYRDAMAALAAKYPADTEAAIFHAAAVAFSADPTDKTYGSQRQAGAVLVRLQAWMPDHPGLAHYIIHAYDVPTLAPLALPAANHYAAIAPGEPHALHMPSHTFTRVGDWGASIRANVASAAAAKREGSAGEELHASDYLMYAYLQNGDVAAAKKLLASLPAMTARYDPTKPGAAAPPAAAFFAMAAIPARFALERGDWKSAATLHIVKTAYPFADAITHFARAIGAARSGDTAAATIEVNALQQLSELLSQRGEGYWSGQVDIERRAAAAWLALASGDSMNAVMLMGDTAGREDATEKNAITPGPLAPAREQLGEMLLLLHRPGDALTEFRMVLLQEPRRARALVGAADAMRQSATTQ